MNEQPDESENVSRDHFRRGLSVRKAEGRDALALAEILTHATAYKVRHGDLAWGRRPTTVDFIERLLLAGQVHVVLSEPVIVGTMSLSWSDETYWGNQPPVAGYVHRIAVHENFHHLHLGRFTLDWCANEVRTENRQFLRLDCDSRNASLCRYYEALGFERVGTKTIDHMNGYLASLYQRCA